MSVCVCVCICARACTYVRVWVRLYMCACVCACILFILNNYAIDKVSVDGNLSLKRYLGCNI